jgi:uncharacterized protein (TIGR01777 family)
MTWACCERCRRSAHRSPVKVLLAGASGFVGTALAHDLALHGHAVSRLVRHQPAGTNEIQWDPAAGSLDASALTGFQAVIGLSGAGISAKRWNQAYKQTLRDSRISPTRTIATALASLATDERPGVFISASAIGFYGERGDQPLPETAVAGTGFLAELVQDWEAAAQPAREAGVRVAFLRTGLVLAASGGLLKTLLPVFKIGAGGNLGSGQQYQSWITLADEVGAIRHVLESDAVSGPVNLAAPNPVRNTELSKAIGAAVHRPSLVPTPAFALRIALGEFADEGVLVSQRVIPELLLSSGYSFEHSDLAAGLTWALSH